MEDILHKRNCIVCKTMETAMDKFWCYSIFDDTIVIHNYFLFLFLFLADIRFSSFFWQENLWICALYLCPLLYRGHLCVCDRLFVWYVRACARVCLHAVVRVYSVRVLVNVCGCAGVYMCALLYQWMCTHCQWLWILRLLFQSCLDAFGLLVYLCELQIWRRSFICNTLNPSHHWPSHARTLSHSPSRFLKVVCKLHMNQPSSAGWSECKYRGWGSRHCWCCCSPRDPVMSASVVPRECECKCVCVADVVVMDLVPVCERGNVRVDC